MPAHLKNFPLPILELIAIEKKELRHMRKKEPFNGVRMKKSRSGKLR
ncbi:MAG: hypothetical protein WC959_04060 [Kiritimatiellales bacterium]